jgi:peptide/nickel transport system substrate-binding protein
VRPLALVAVLFCGVACRESRPPVPVRDRLVVAHATAPVSLAPNVANEELTLSILSNVYEGLVDFDAKLAPVPGLAESWHTEDDLTWVFRLRPGVRFHDGTPLRAEDAARSIEWARSDPSSRRRPELAEISSVEVIDERTLVLRTSVPFAALGHRLASVSITKPTSGPGGAHHGTGPYRITQAGASSTVLEAFDQYVHGPAAIRHVEFRVVPKLEERVAQLRRGDVDFVIDVPAESLPTLQAEPHLKVVTQQGLRVIYLGFDTARDRSPDVSLPNPFRDVRVRRAVALALDRGEIVSSALAGQAELVDQIVAPPVFGYSRSLTPRPHDVDGARRLLAEAGHRAGFAVTLDYMPGKYRAMPAVVAAISRDLRQVGIEVRPRGCEPGPFLERVESRQTALWLMGWMSTGGEASITYGYLLHTPVGGQGVDNGGGYSNADLDRLLESARGVLSPERRAQILAEAAALVHEDVPVVPLYRQVDLYAVARKLSFEPRVDRRTQAYRMRWQP